MFGLFAGKQAAAGQTAYDFTFEGLNGTPIALADYRGRPILVVNTASKCGFTPQYKGLEALYRKYKDRGLVVIGVPSNDFGGQEPGSADEIKSFCELNYGVTFPMAAKQVVKGSAAHPFYQWARQSLGLGSAPKWNFHKYLVGADGRLVDFYLSTTAPDSPKIAIQIEKELGSQ